MSRRWQRNERVLDAARTNLWPAGYHPLGVHWANGIQWNKDEIDRRIALGEYTAAQCLSRLTDGMPNHSGPPNGPGRPTLATKWRKNTSAQPGDIEEHVAALREHVAVQVAQQLGLLPSTSHDSSLWDDTEVATVQRDQAPHHKRPLDSTDEGPRKLARIAFKPASTAASSGSVFKCGLRLTGRPGDTIPGGGGQLTTKIFVSKSQSVRQNQQAQLSRLKTGELSIEYALFCMRVGGPLRRHWDAARHPEIRSHIDELCRFLERLRQAALDGSYDSRSA